MAPQNANRYLKVPTSRGGDFQEEICNSPLEWLSTSLAWASHVGLLEHIQTDFASLSILFTFEFFSALPFNSQSSALRNSTFHL